HSCRSEGSWSSSSWVLRQRLAACFGKRRMSGVLFGYQRIFNTPGDVQIWVVPGDAALVGGIVKIATLIQELDWIGKRQKSVCESARNVDLILLLGRQQYAGPLPEVRRAGTNINHDIERFAFDNTAQFRLRMAHLIV